VDDGWDVDRTGEGRCNDLLERLVAAVREACHSSGGGRGGLRRGSGRVRVSDVHFVAVGPDRLRTRVGRSRSVE